MLNCRNSLLCIREIICGRWTTMSDSWCIFRTQRIYGRNLCHLLYLCAQWQVQIPYTQMVFCNQKCHSSASSGNKINKRNTRGMYVFCTIKKPLSGSCHFRTFVFLYFGQFSCVILFIFKFPLYLSFLGKCVSKQI